MAVAVRVKLTEVCPPQGDLLGRRAGGDPQRHGGVAKIVDMQAGCFGRRHQERARKPGTATAPTGGGEDVATGSLRGGKMCLQLAAVTRRGMDPRSPAGGRTVPTTLSVFQRAELALQAAEQHGGAERLDVSVGKAHQRLDVPVGEHFGGLTGRAAVTARDQPAEADPLVD